MEQILAIAKEVNEVVNGVVWGVPAMVLIVGVGVVLSVGTGFVQFRRFGYACRKTISRLFRKGEAGHGAMTPSQALCSSNLQSPNLLSQSLLSPQGLCTFSVCW